MIYISNVLFVGYKREWAKTGNACKMYNLISVLSRCTGEECYKLIIGNSNY